MFPGGLDDLIERCKESNLRAVRSTTYPPRSDTYRAKNSPLLLGSAELQWSPGNPDRWHRMSL